MLRASAPKFGVEANLRALTDAGTDLGVTSARELLAAADAAVLRDTDEIEVARADLLTTVGEPGAVRAFATAGNFEMMNRVAEGTGIPVPAQSIDRMRDTIADLGIDSFLKS